MLPRFFPYIVNSYCLFLYLILSVGADGIQEKYALVQRTNASEMEKSEIDPTPHLHVTSMVFNALKYISTSFGAFVFLWWCDFPECYTM